MSGPIKGTGSTIPAYCKPEDGHATVQQGEYTLDKVAQRLGIKDPADVAAFKEANSHLDPKKPLQQGQDICIPEKKTAQPANDQKREIGKEYPDKDKDVKVPEKNVKGVNVQVPKPKMETDDTYERGTNRKDDQQRLDNARRPDDRDLDPKVLDKQKRDKTEGSARNHVDGQVKEGFDEANTQGQKEKYDAREQMIREQGDKILGKPKPKHMPGFSK